MIPLTLSLQNIQCERDERLLFGGISGTFSSGDMVQVTGENGAGKTTLLRVLAGISDHYTGALTWQSQSCPRVSKAFLQRHLLYLGHKPAVSISLTARENLAWYFGLNGLSHSAADRSPKANYEYALECVGLRGYEDVPCKQMSAGQQRRVALARLFLSQAPLWILDEPFTAIDVSGVALLESCIDAHCASGGLVIMTSHQSVKLKLLQTIDLLRTGRVLADA